VALAEGAPNLMQRLSRFPTAPHVGPPLRGKPLQLLRMIRRGHLHTVALGERALRIPVDRNALQAARIVAQLFASVALDGHCVALSICARDAGILSGLDAERLRPLRVAENIAFHIVLRVLSICAAHLLPHIQHMDAMLLRIDSALALHRSMDVLIDLATRFIIGRNHKRSLRRAHILAGYLVDPLSAVLNLQHAALAVEITNGFADLASRKLLDGFSECRISLSDDFIQVRRSQPCVLELRISR
jgi:hypothetical protein